MNTLGIDIGGSGIKGAVVNTETGEFIQERFRLPTPEKAEPGDVAKTVKQLVDHFRWKGAVGAGFPAVVLHGVTYTAANVHPSWIGTNAEDLFHKETSLPVYVLNDADAAGVAEMAFGAGRGQKGTVLMLTIGTGIGSAIFVDGVLLPNTEFGHIKIRGKDAEWRSSDAVRQQKKWSWKQWSKRLEEHIQYLEALIWPDLIIVGGGVSKKYDKFFPYLKLRAKLLPAQLLNEAGIVGAAIYASQQESKK